MGVREIDRSLEQWQMGVKDLRRRVILAPTPRERERWYAILLLAQGLTAAATAEALERDPHTIGRWASAFGEGGPAALIFEQTGGSPGSFSFQGLAKPRMAKAWPGAQPMRRIAAAMLVSPPLRSSPKTTLRNAAIT